ncbi:hypothetical protein [Hydrogenimonas sp.]
MKRVSKIAAIAIMGIGLSLFASGEPVQAENNSAAASTKTSLDAQIDRIKHADPAKRREMMNHFKEQLARMNREERIEAISQLKEKMLGGAATRHMPQYARPNMMKMKNVIQTDQVAQIKHFDMTEKVHHEEIMNQVMHKPNGNQLPFGSSTESGNAPAPGENMPSHGMNGGRSGALPQP